MKHIFIWRASIAWCFIYKAKIIYYDNIEITIFISKNGIYISKIVDGSGADKAGLEIGNIIVGIDNNDITKFSDLTDYLYTKKKGEKVVLKIKYISGRQYKEKEVEVTLS